MQRRGRESAITEEPEQPDQQHEAARTDEVDPYVVGDVDRSVEAVDGVAQK